jgi:hypothetical protein
MVKLVNTLIYNPSGPDTTEDLENHEAYEIYRDAIRALTTIKSKGLKLSLLAATAEIANVRPIL